MGGLPLERDEIIAILVRDNLRLFPALLREISECCGFHAPTCEDLYEIYGAFNDYGLNMVYRCFVKREMTSEERFTQYRFVQWLAKRHKQMKKMDFGRGMSTVGGIDLVGRDENDDIIIVVECSCREEKAREEDLDKWIENVKLIKKAIADKLKMAYFVDIRGYTQEALDSLLRRKDITSDGRLKTGVIGRVNLGLCEEQEGQIRKLEIM
ncbi:MAG: hypothetical protein JSW53_03555 [Candidatus Bathyarchaeota archaeon]|nr:MAG: hypothetical protein JSW53_03555 [Candidatus Bathyarchaeota archaeon]